MVKISARQKILAKFGNKQQETQMKKIIALSALALAMSACSQSEPTAEVTTANASAQEGQAFVATLDLNMPEYVALDEEARAALYSQTNAQGYPRISFLPAGTNVKHIVESDPQHASGSTAGSVNLRWRYVKTANPEDLSGVSQVQGITPWDNTATTSEGANNRSLFRVVRTATGERLEVYYRSGSAANWWGPENETLCMMLTYGVQVQTRSITEEQNRLKFYYHSGLPFTRNGLGSISKESLSASSNYSTPTAGAIRKLHFTTESSVHDGVMYPIMTAPMVTKRETTAQKPGTLGSPYSFATPVTGHPMVARGTILSLAFKNETGAPITITDLEAKNEGLAYSGYFSAMHTAQNGSTSLDGVHASGVMTGTEVLNATPLKFVETTLSGYGQHSVSSITNNDLWANFELYPNPSAAAKGLELGAGATTSNTTQGRVHLWGFPKSSANYITVRVKYRQAGGSEVYSRPQRISAPNGGSFEETKAYLKTIRVVAP